MAPHTAGALHIVITQPAEPLLSPQAPKPDLEDGARYSKGLTFRAKRTAKALFHHTVEIFRRRETSAARSKASYSETSPASPSIHMASTWGSSSQHQLSSVDNNIKIDITDSSDSTSPRNSNLATPLTANTPVSRATSLGVDLVSNVDAPRMLKRSKSESGGGFKQDDSKTKQVHVATIEPATTQQNDGEEEDRMWEQVRAIPDVKYCKLVLEALALSREVKLSHVAVTGHGEGAFHRVTFVRLIRGSKVEDYVVRVPAHGISKLWSKEDEYMLERETDMVRYIRRHTKTPIAELFDHDATLDNLLGMPYIVEARIEGIPAYDIWFPDGEEDNVRAALRNGDHPSEETEKKRINFLCSLARAMNELGTLRFDQTGSLHVQHGSRDPPTISSYYTWTCAEEPGKSNRHPPHSSVQELVKGPLDDSWNIEAQCEDHGDVKENIIASRRVGIRKILDMVLSSPAFNQIDEYFTVCHPDLDLQNILTDKDGNITGIIDWDGAFFAPRCMGASSVPKFLNRDWFPEGVGGLYSFPHLIWRTDEYRNIYAAAMIEGSPMKNHPDGHLIAKSAIYTSVLGGLLKYIGGGDVEDFVTKLLQSIPRLHRLPICEYLVALGNGLPHEEVLLKGDIAALLEPQLPEEKYFELVRSFTDVSEPVATSTSSLNVVETIASDE